MARRRVFQDAFKRRAVKRVLVDGLSVSEAASESGVQTTQLRRWMAFYDGRQSAEAATKQRSPGTSLEMAGLVEAFVALAQQSRWTLFLLLLRAGPEGLSLTEIKQRMRLRATAVSAHLRVLEQASLIKVLSESRKVGNDWGKGIATCTIDYEHLGQVLRMVAKELHANAPAILQELVDVVADPDLDT